MNTISGIIQEIVKKGRIHLSMPHPVTLSAADTALIQYLYQLQGIAVSPLPLWNINLREKIILPLVPYSK